MASLIKRGKTWYLQDRVNGRMKLDSLLNAFWNCVRLQFLKHYTQRLIVRREWHTNEGAN